MLHSSVRAIGSLSGHFSRDQFGQPRQDKHCQDSATDQLDPSELRFQSRDVGFGGQFPASGLRRMPHDGSESVRLVFLEASLLQRSSGLQRVKYRGIGHKAEYAPEPPASQAPRRLQSKGIILGIMYLASREPSDGM